MLNLTSLPINSGTSKDTTSKAVPINISGYADLH